MSKQGTKRVEIGGGILTFIILLILTTSFFQEVSVDSQDPRDGIRAEARILNPH